ncbi:MAG: hypothetical protein VCD00_06120 [Candidatus Hydrogenedentota bacterium]
MRPAFTVAFLVGWAVTSLAAAQEKKLPLEGEVFSVSGHEAFVILPEDAKSSEGHPVGVVRAHLGALSWLRRALDAAAIHLRRFCHRRD